VQRAPYAHFPLHPTRNRPLLDTDRFMLGDRIADEGLRPNTEQDVVIPAKVLAMLESGWHRDPVHRIAALQMKSVVDEERDTIECDVNGGQAVQGANAEQIEEFRPSKHGSDARQEQTREELGLHGSADRNLAQCYSPAGVCKGETASIGHSARGAVLSL